MEFSNNNQGVQTDPDLFEAICELITADHFQSGQMDFFSNNCQVFSEKGEENLHQCKNIHEEYIVLINKVIDTGLLHHGFSREDIDQFYSDFPSHYATFA